MVDFDKTTTIHVPEKRVWIGLGFAIHLDSPTEPVELVRVDEPDHPYDGQWIAREDADLEGAPFSAPTPQAYRDAWAGALAEPCDPPDPRDERHWYRVLETGQVVPHNGRPDEVCVRASGGTFAPINTTDPIIEQLDALRRERGIGQVELAERSGIDQANLSRYFAGKYTPSVRALRRIAGALGYDLSLTEIRKGDR